MYIDLDLRKLCCHFRFKSSLFHSLIPFSSSKAKRKTQTMMMTTITCNELLRSDTFVLRKFSNSETFPVCMHRDIALFAHFHNVNLRLDKDKLFSESDFKFFVIAQLSVARVASSVRRKAIATIAVSKSAMRARPRQMRKSQLSFSHFCTLSVHHKEAGVEEENEK